MGFLLSGVSNERVFIRTINSSHVGRISLHGSYSFIRWTVMNHPVLLGSTLTDAEFKHLCDLMGFIKCPTKNSTYFRVLSNLSIGCSPIHPHHDFSNCAVSTMNEFLSYIKEQKLLRILE